VPAGARDLWPNDLSREQSLVLSWFGTTNRYFTLCVHAPYDPPSTPSRSIESSLVTVRPIADLALPADRQVIQTELYGPAKTVAAGETASWDLGVYAGPLERGVLESSEPYIALNMRDLIVYLMSGCCTFCTFSWLADFLVVFLSFLHSVVGDWAIAIILLVCIVRLLLHPVMKRGQIQMQRMSRLMTELKPELDALQKKYKDDPTRMQSEQRRLFMERGVNPAGCVGGLLPTFLQMPIWIALYAMLFFAFELRQQPAFFGLFQLLPDVNLGTMTLFGQFLGDLSRPDHFVEFSSPVNIWITDLTGVNLLPLLMGVIFFVQQKYMSPPPSPNMTPEQLQQQKMMKVMMVVLFPLMLFQAPSGLTLYILTSSSIGIIEGKRIRKLIDGMDLTAKPEMTEKATKRKARKDQLARMYAAKLEEARKKQAAKRKGPQKSFKKKD
jgi:YidC/Oxa1 family membrane protein insertase